MKYLAIITCGMILASPFASACMVSSAKIEGTIVGNDIEDKTCLVKVELKKVTPHKNCPLKLKVGEEITVKTKFSVDDCPDDEGPVKGEVSSGGQGHYTFSGKM